MDPISNNDIESELSAIEKLTSKATSLDEYLEALNRNVRLLNIQRHAPTVEGGSAFGGVDPNNLPIGLAGKALEKIPSGQSGAVVFNVTGSDLVTQLQMKGGNASSGGIVQVVDTGNIATPITNIKEQDLSIGNSIGATGATNFELTETDDPVTVDVGDGKVEILNVSVSDKSNAYMVGTTDAVDSLYNYIVDGEKLLDSQIEQPLGLYNDPFEFPIPIEFENNFVVEVERPSSGTGPQDYVSKLIYYK